MLHEPKIDQRKLSNLKDREAMYWEKISSVSQGHHIVYNTYVCEVTEGDERDKNRKHLSS